MNASVSVQTLRCDQVPADVTERLAEWTQAIFGEEETRLAWAEFHWRVLVFCDGELASTLAITLRAARVGGTAVRLAGIGNLMTLPPWRGRGLATRATEEAARFMRETLEVEFGFLLCSADLVPYYRALGWRPLDVPVWFDQPSGPQRWEQEALVLACSNQTWPDGIVDLCGLPW